MLIHQGKVLQEHLNRERISADDLQQALREHGITRGEDVSLAVLEIDGSISVLTNDEMPAVARPHHRIRFLRKKGT